MPGVQGGIRVCEAGDQRTTWRHPLPASEVSLALAAIFRTRLPPLDPAGERTGDGRAALKSTRVSGNQRESAMARHLRAMVTTCPFFIFGSINGLDGICGYEGLFRAFGRILVTLDAAVTSRAMAMTQSMRHMSVPTHPFRTTGSKGYLLDFGSTTKNGTFLSDLNATNSQQIDIYSCYDIEHSAQICIIEHDWCYENVSCQWTPRATEMTMFSSVIEETILYASSLEFKDRLCFESDFGNY